MAAKQLQFSLVIRAVDAASAPIRAVSQSITSMVRNVSTAVRTSTENFEAWNKATERSERLTKFAAATQLAGQELHEVSEKAKSVVEGPIESWGDFEHAINRVRIITGATGDQLARVELLSKQVGATGQYTATEVAETVSVLASAGMKNVNDLITVMPAVKNTAIATGESLHDAAHLAIDTWQEFKLNIADVPGAMDAISKATTSTSLTLADLSENFKYMGAMASMAKMTVPDTVAVLAQLSNLGIRGSMGGTAFREILQRIAAPEKKAKEALEELHIKTTDRGNVRPIMDILGDFYRKTRPYGTAEQTRLYHDFFGERAIEGAEALGRSSASGQFETLRKSVNDSSGVASSMAAKAMDDQVGASKRLAGATDNLRISLGKLLTTTLVPSIDKLAAFTTWLNNVAEAHPRLTQAVLIGVAAFGTFAAGLSTVILTIGSLASVLSVASLAMGGSATGVQILGALFSEAGIYIRAATILTRMFTVAAWESLIPLAPLGIAVGALALAGYTIYKNWEPIRDFFKELFTDFGGTVSSLKDWIIDLSKTAVATLEEIFTHPIDSLKKIPEAFRNLWTAMNGGDLGPGMKANAPSARSAAAENARTAGTSVKTAPAPAAPVPTISTSPTVPATQTRSRVTLGPARETVTSQRERDELDRRSASGYGAQGGTVEHVVGGRIDISIDSEGRPRVKKLQSRGGIDLSVHTGHATAGG